MLAWSDSCVTISLGVCPLCLCINILSHPPINSSFFVSSPFSLFSYITPPSCWMHGLSFWYHFLMMMAHFLSKTSIIACMVEFAALISRYCHLFPLVGVKSVITMIKHSTFFRLNPFILQNRCISYQLIFGYVS